MADVIVKKSHIEGKGVFAARDFKKGEVVIEWKTSKPLKIEETRNLPKSEKRYLSYIGNGRWVLQKPPARFVNHSCEANTYMENKKDIAKCNIKKGEETTSDYSLEGIAKWKFKCHCGSKYCRKIVYGDFSKLDAKTRKKLEPYLQDWYKKEHHK
ncbi:MAG: hypothetical protein NTY20_00910 [Candidatus Aenigmarchaeota archaeon]|nr:hypothetical protein [Candidatus Aenigmarchaeota archaeon]